MARIRLAFARIAQETHALSPVTTTLSDFDAIHLMEGPELLAACQRGAMEAQGFLKNAELSGCVRAALKDGEVELVPLLSAWAVPSGPLDRQTFDELLGRVTDRLRAAGPVDAVMLSLHGAMGVEGLVEPDALLCEAIKSASGGAPLGVSMDLHANLNARVVQSCEVLHSYKTNPHRDHAAIGAQTTRTLLRVARSEVQPAAAWRSLPMVMGGGLTLDFLKPMRGIFRWMRKQERRSEVLGCSLFMCHLWNDTPGLGWASHVYTDGQPAMAEELAEELAAKAWAVRHELPPELPDAREAVEQARQAVLARALGTVCMCDASDVVAAGAPGENTKLLRAFQEHGQDLLAYLPLRDPVAVEELWQTEVGESVSVRVGGRLDPARNEPAQVSGRLIWKGERHAFGRTVALDLGQIQLVLTSGPAMAMKPSFYSEVGLSPWRADVVVVKSFFPFRLFFALHNRKAIYVRTGGITDFDAARELVFNRPLHPFQEVADWRPSDRQRRGVS